MMKIYNVALAWTKNDGGTISTNVRQISYTDKEVVSQAEAVGRFLIDDFKNNVGWSIHCWSCNTVELTDKTE